MKTSFFSFPLSPWHRMAERATWLIAIVLFLGSGQAQAQSDPFTRFKQAAQLQDTVRSTLPAVTLTPASPVFKANLRSVIPFKPFEMVDKTGRRIPPTELVTLSDGRKMTAQDFFSRLNETERKLNAQGYSLRTDKEVTASQTITKKEDLDEKVPTLPQPVSARRNEEDLKQFMNPVRKAGNIVLKPLHEYNNQEKLQIEKVHFSNENEQLTVRPLSMIDTAGRGRSTQRLLKTINETKSKEWGLGSNSTFRAAIRGDLSYFANIYSYDPAAPGRSMSEFKASGNVRVYGSIFSHGFDLMTGSAAIDAPADSSKKMTTKVVVNIGGTTILNLNESFAQSKTFAGIRSYDIEKNASFRVYIVAGIYASGKVGVRGTAGVQYGADAYRSFASVRFKPIADISGYAEAGADFLGIVGGGVGGRLTFFKGNLDMQAFIGIIANTQSQIVLANSYYFGYDVEVLKGKLYCYAELCIPDWVPWIGGDCTRYDHDLFNWSGYDRSGTIAEGTRSYVIANL